MAVTTLYLPVRLQYDVAAAGHAFTTRATYTVPIGKIAIITQVYMQMIVGAAVAVNNITTKLLINGVNIFYLANGVAGATTLQQECSGYADLVAGDVVVIQTNNLSAVSCEYHGSFLVREYQ